MVVFGFRPSILRVQFDLKRCQRIVIQYLQVRRVSTITTSAKPAGGVFIEQESNRSSHRRPKISNLLGRSREACAEFQDTLSGEVPSRS
jgi:hypothetical protein